MILNPSQFAFIKKAKTFLVDGKKVRFDTSYKLINPKTKGEMNFEFKESTGSEWDPKTLWIYKSKEGFILKLTNEDVTPAHLAAYLNAKLRN